VPAAAAGIASGATVAALAWAPRAGHWDPAEPGLAARGSGQAWAVTGEAHHVLDGDTADVLLAAARTADGTGLFEVDPADPAITRRAVTTMDTTRRLAVVALEGAPGRCLGPGAGIRRWPGPGTSPASRWLPSKQARHSRRWS
jgi:hypothetical protein